MAKRLAAAEEGYGKGAEGGVVAFEQRPELAAQVGRLAPRRGAEDHLEERPRLHRVLPHKRIAVRRRHAVPLAHHLMRGPEVTPEERVTALPDVSTVKEQGVDMVYTSWHGIMAPKGTDPEIVAAVNRALDEILTRPDIRERFGALNAGLVGSRPVAVTAFVTEQAGALSELIEMSGDSRNRARTGAPDDPAPAFHERTDYPRWMMSDQPHVLFVTVDQWPAHLLGCMGHPDIETPTLDMLERSDTLYRNCYAETPISIPSRRSMMTGLTARGHGNRDFQPALRMSAKAQTLAGAFSAAGYQTGAIGKLHANPPRDRIGFDDALLAEEGRGNLGGPDD
ncbi:tripartite tricarboxylate transporter substrate-binding protein [Salipiger thiooxidans]|uniref:tripartite tricarboxylate transporter substrate-binding protein n=1 Tax=Salipiger thiooxidans TaxID=282683 RepID=UPI001CD3AD72|nr:tripartite tricarboxylate transporter substrate-binding protein [Salipiger thiooxidans]MCA0847970.1 sulfatase-like hydrolase/transferase [Salipiger thiooxidans]